MTTTDQGVSDVAAERAGQAMERGREAVQQGREKAAEAAQKTRGAAARQLDERTTMLAERALSLAEATRRVASELRDQGDERTAGLVERAAGGADRLGRYLRDGDGDRMVRDLEDVARKRPWLTAGGCFAIGLAASRFLKASAQSRGGSQQPVSAEADTYDRDVAAVSRYGPPAERVESSPSPGA